MGGHGLYIEALPGSNVECMLVVTCVCVTDLEPGEVGLSLSYLMPMMWYMESMCRLSADVEIQVASNSP